MNNWIFSFIFLYFLQSSFQFDFKNPEVNIQKDDNKFNFNFEYLIKDFITRENIQKNLQNKKNKLKIGNLDSGISQNFSELFPLIKAQNFTDDKDNYDYNGHGTFTMSVC